MNGLGHKEERGEERRLKIHNQENDKITEVFKTNRRQVPFHLAMRSYSSHILSTVRGLPRTASTP
jgi:hypothetical protein